MRASSAVVQHKQTLRLLGRATSLCTGYSMSVLETREHNHFCICKAPWGCAPSNPAVPNVPLSSFVHRVQKDPNGVYKPTKPYTMLFWCVQEGATETRTVKPALPDAPPVELPPLPTEFPPLPDIKQPLIVEARTRGQYHCRMLATADTCGKLWLKPRCPSSMTTPPCRAVKRPAALLAWTTSFHLLGATVKCRSTEGT